MLITLTLVSACSTTPDPAEVCSSDWIATRTNKALGRIEKQATSSFKTLSKVSATYAKGETPGVLQLYSMSRALKRLEKELTRGQGITDIKTVARTCNDPDILSDSVRSLLQRQGVSERFITTIENLPFYGRMLSDISRQDFDSSE